MPHNYFKLPIEATDLPPIISSFSEAHHSSRRPIEATMIQGTNVNIGHANMNMTNHQVFEEPRERLNGAHLVPEKL